MAKRKPFLLRLSPEVLDALRGWAAQEMRSVNGQIEFILKQAVMRRTGSSPEPESAGRPPDEEPR